MQDSQSKLRKLFKISAIFLVLIFIVLLGLTIYRTLTFRIVSINPNIKNVTVISPFLKINFNKTLSTGVYVSATPNIISSYKIQGKQININLIIPMNSNQTYKVNVKYIYDIKGQHIPDQNFVFKPSQVSSSSLSSDQNQVLLNQQKNYNQSIESNKFLQLLPFTGPNFEYRVDYNVKYTSQGNQSIIEITAPDSAARQDALNWIKSQSVDPSTLNIQYITGQP